ncbi:peptidase [Streptomyces sp. NPDC089919]|uniref:peptidase n=1 Tax=Streptomyces sp. NPDC089919 TaxID=3155188 RepID=UPI00343D935B
MRRISLLAAAGLVALGLTTPAQAAGTPDYVVGGLSEVALRPYAASGTAKAARADFTVETPTSKGFSGRYALTFDLSALKGIADVTAEDGADCARDGARLVCTGYEIPPGLTGVVSLQLKAAKGSKKGQHGAIKVTGKAPGITFKPFTSNVTVGGPDLVMQRLKLKNTMKVGQRQATPIAFANKGTRAAKGVVLELMHSRGLEFVEKYDNCAYRPDRSADGRGFGTTVCTFTGSFDAGYLYELDAPLHLRATSRAWYDVFLYKIREAGPADRSALRATGAAGAHRLELKRAPATPAGYGAGGDLDPGDNEREADFKTPNTADFAATALALKGKAGETVKASVGFRNRGPAWIYYRSAESIALVDFKVPAGARVTKKPAGCSATNTDGTQRQQQLGAPRYRCATDYTILDKEKVAFPFELTVDRVVADAKGSVSVGGWQPGPVLAPLPFDTKKANNTAAVVLNSTHSVPAPGSSPSPSASASASPTPSATPTTTPSATPTATATAPGGDLAHTGSDARTLAAAAAAAVAAGAAVVIGARRRRPGRHG